jgi:hypothetical protein
MACCLFIIRNQKVPGTVRYESRLVWFPSLTLWNWVYLNIYSICVLIYSMEKLYTPSLYPFFCALV